MPSFSDAYGALRTRLEANVPAGVTALYFDGEDGPLLPNTPAAFVFFELRADGQAFVAGFGGGRGLNLYRNPCLAIFYVFVPRGVGLLVATDLAKQIALLFRSYRDAMVSCFAATVDPLGAGSSMKPQGLASEVDNYYCAAVEVSLFFDEIG
jgi:hypothetical protein